MLEKFEKFKIENPKVIFGGDNPNVAGQRRRIIEGYSEED